MTSPDPRPAVLFLCHPLTGHLTPTLKISKSLCASGHSVFFLGPTAHKARIIASGAVFIPLKGKADYNDLKYYSRDSERPPVPDYHFRSWKDRAMVDVMKQWLDPIPEQWERVKYALATVMAYNGPGADVVIISEAIFHGILPLFYGAECITEYPRLRAVLCLSVTVPLIRSAHLPPFGSSLPYDGQLENTHAIEAKWESWAKRSAPYKDLFEMKLAEAGATRGFNGTMFDGSQYAHFDAFLQLGSPSFFYPREWPEKLRFIGVIPKEPPPPHLPLMPTGSSLEDEARWSESHLVTILQTARQQGEKIVVVAQGTVETNPQQLVIPACQAMVHRTTPGRADVFLVAISASCGRDEVDAVCPPGNRMYVPRAGYDTVLRYADAWVHNGGYGAVQHGIANGVPMVIAGEGQDKTENGKRLAFSGAGIDLGTATPSVEALRSAIDAILDQKSYKERVEVLRKESEGLDCFGTVARVVAECCAYRSNDVVIPYLGT